MIKYFFLNKELHVFYKKKSAKQHDCKIQTNIVALVLNQASTKVFFI